MHRLQPSKLKPVPLLDFTSQWPKLSTCNCQATEHPLALNCINCGRIICDADLISTTCGYCGSIIENLSEIIPKSKLKKIQRSQFSNEGVVSCDQIAESNTSLDAALRHRDKLVDYGINSVTRTAIYDESASFDTLEAEEQVFLEFSVVGNSIETKLVARKATS